VRALVQGERLVMSTSQGPFPMEMACALRRANEKDLRRLKALLERS